MYLKKWFKNLNHLEVFFSCKIKLPNYVLLNSQIPQNERPIKTKNMLFVYFKSPADKGHKPNITNPQATIG